MKKLSVNYKVIIQVLIWGLLTLLPYLVSNSANHYNLGNIPGHLYVLMGLIHIALFYTQALYLYPRFFCRQKWWIYLLSAVMLLGLSMFLKWWIAETWWPGLFKIKKEFYGIIIGGSVEIYLISLVYSRVRASIRKEKEIKEREAVHLATELKFLRSQISPHFLFNVLTNLVSLARKKSDQLESSLITLAELMRYMLYDTQGKKVVLSTEIRYLNSYIELQRLRFGNDVIVESVIEPGDKADYYTIEPMLLIPFVENAFKHGVSVPERPQIGIKGAVRDGWLHFEVSNTFDETVSAGKEEHTGLGLNNVRTRLQLLYPKDYRLDIRKEGNWFTIILTLKLI